MFCEKCGKDNPEGMKFCEACGAPLEAAEAVEEVTEEVSQEAVEVEAVEEVAEEVTETAEPEAEAPASEEIYEEAPAPEEGEDNKERIIKIAAAIVVLIVALFCVIKIGSCAVHCGPTAPIKKELKLMNDKKITEKDVEKYLKSIPDEILEIQMGEQKESDFVEQRTESLEQTRKAIEKKYGSNVKYSFEVVDRTKLTKEEIEEIEDEYKEYYDKKIDVKKGYKYMLKTKVKGKKEKDVTYSEETVIKVDGKWITY